MSLEVAPAEPADVPLVVSLIRELAEYERLAHEVVARPEDVQAALFADPPAAFARLARWDGEPAGFAVCFPNFSTFLGRRGMYLEDLYVRPAFRGRGIGRALLASVAAQSVAQGCERLDWAVLDWNQPAIDFYQSLGARLQRDWRLFRLEGSALRRFAANQRS
ncbi:MAG: GNAT family N-acetyltransferase [Gammaproteobacteria bacterium]|jgi:diamine N-acetyltransferase|nr:GNAT family N-acetyltransferase [Gammaproteobacteria bacterium]